LSTAVKSPYFLVTFLI